MNDAHDPADPQPVSRSVGAHLEAEITEPAELVLSIAVADQGANVQERLDIAVDGSAVPATEIVAAHGTRLHVLRDVPVGRLVVDYRARIVGAVPQPPSDENQDAVDRVLYLRPSRYCESDTMAAVAGVEFAGLEGQNLLHAVSSWVGQHLLYLSGSSRPTDGAVHTYLARQGVCRDFAHLVVTLLRARGVPARLVSVYAPGLHPMDFHAVAEARLGDDWYVLDATTLAPRESMVRIATGRDASDTAFVTVQDGRLDLTSMQVTATMDPTLPDDDVSRLVRLT